MKKLLLVGSLLLMVSISTFAGGLLTNTNQHISFLRMIARGTSTELDAVYSNPAGVAFMDEGFHLSVNIQSAYQTRTIDADFARYGADNYIKRYKGTASAPIIPSFQAVYKVGDWALSGSFAIGGGGGKASFDDGLPMFDSKVMAGIFASTQGAVTTDMYTINSAMDGRQYIYGAQLGLSYRINDHISVYTGGRMNYVSSGYEGYLDATLKKEYQGGPIPTDLAHLELDLDQTGWGLTPIIGADFKFCNWTIGLKYEFMTNLNIENKTKKNSDPEGALADYKNGKNIANDIPAMLMVAAGYEFTPKIRATVEYHQFFDKDASMADIPGTDRGRQKALTGNTHEYLCGVEWDVLDKLTISGGYQYTDYGLADDFQSDTSFYCDSYSIGLGAAFRVSSKATINVGYFWTNYKDYTKVSANYNGTGLAGTDIYSRTNKVFGVGVDYKF